MGAICGNADLSANTAKMSAIKAWKAVIISNCWKIDKVTTAVEDCMKRKVITVVISSETKVLKPNTNAVQSYIVETYLATL